MPWVFKSHTAVVMLSDPRDFKDIKSNSMCTLVGIETTHPFVPQYETSHRCPQDSETPHSQYLAKFSMVPANRFDEELLAVLFQYLEHQLGE